MDHLRGRAMLGTEDAVCRALVVFAAKLWYLGCGAAGERKIISFFASLLPVLSEIFGCRTVTSCSLFCMGLIARILWRSATAVGKCCNRTEYGAGLHGAKYSEKSRKGCKPSDIS